MWAKLCFLIFLIYLAKIAMSRTSHVCRSYRKFYPYTGTITPYFNVYTSSEEPMTLTNCEPMHVWMLSRHGTRYPREHSMRQMMNLMNRIRHKGQEIKERIYKNDTCIPVYANHSDTWQTCPEFTRGKGLQLTIGGEIDMASLGERIRTKLAKLFDKKASKSFTFRTTASERGIESMIAFFKGIFNVSLASYLPNEPQLFSALHMTERSTIPPLFTGNTLMYMEVGPSVNDTLLKLYDTCAAWKDEINKEMEAFVNGPEMTKVFDDVSRRMKIPKIYKIEKVSLLYDICRFERIVCPIKPSLWCDMFTEDEMKAFEYEQDLQFYYDAGPGDALNGQLGCHLVRDMFERFMKLEINKTEERGVFYFAHSHMITMFLSALGVGKDSVPLTATNFGDMGNRRWRVSRLVPFNANIAAVFHRCNSSDAPFKVAFYLNEYPLTLEGCKNGVCDWAQLKEKFGAIAANCNTVCRKN